MDKVSTGSSILGVELPKAKAMAPFSLRRLISCLMPRSCETTNTTSRCRKQKIPATAFGHYLTATEHGFSAFLFRFQNCFLPLFHLTNNNKRSVGGCQPQPPEKMTERRPFIDRDQPGGGTRGGWGGFSFLGN